ncbi:MAG: EAL domain-containing protein [Gammaproteobacteria bacterium]|nr:EAL domain-containing protein [Gammaproteobacteria bacterium]
MNAKPRSGKKSERQRTKVLIVEDSPTQAEQLTHLLEERDFHVTHAADGEQALAEARRRKPALVISDIVMPRMDGYTLCKTIKSDKKLKDVPVILVTSLVGVQDVMKGLECGADNFIRKPYDKKYLLARIDYILMNCELRKNQKMQMGVEILLGGQKHFITAERQQIVDLLISIYEEAVHLNEELKTRQRELAHSNQSLSGLYRVAAGLNAAATEHEVANKALERALDLPGVRAGWIVLHENDTGFRIAAARNLPPALEATGAFEGDCLCRRQFLSGQLDGATNIMECERLRRINGEAHGLRYHASVPLWIGDRRLGIMNLVGADETLFDEDDLRTLHGVGNQVAIALERARLHEHLESLVEQRTAALTAEIEERKRAEARVMRLNRVYAVLSGINTTIVRVREPQELFDEACRIAVKHGQFTFAWMGTFDVDTQQVTPVARAGRDDGYLDQINLTAAADTPGNCRLTAEAITQAKPVICNDIASDDRMNILCNEALSRGYRSVAVFPLIVEGRPVGVFVLYAPEAGVFDEEEMRLLVEMAGDISFTMDKLEKEERLNYLAYYDVITGLPNRALLQDRVEQRIGAAYRDHKVFPVVMFNLNRFRSINETLGRQVGDDLLRQVAQRLQGVLGGTDILAHFSADYFGIVSRRHDEKVNIVHVLERMLSAIRDQSFLIGGQELHVSARIGVSCYPTDGEDAETLLRNADAALGKAKLSGDRYLFYAPEFNARAAEKLTLENKLRRALEQEQLVLHYQPKVNLKNGRICGLEALLRWNDPETGLVPPMKFIPLLEETGMIIEAGQWALEKAVSDSLVWQTKGLRSPRIAVNVSPVQLQQKDFVSMMERVVKGDGDVAGRLELEITESLVMQDIEANIQKLRGIREMGIEIAIDDFGTGYSSLSYIAKLPVNALKIDRAFIINMTSNADDLSIVSAIISLAHSLKLRVIAEGVETEEQANLLRLLKCDEMQGYLLTPAVPAEQIEQFLREKKALPGT